MNSEARAPLPANGSRCRSCPASKSRRGRWRSARARRDRVVHSQPAAFATGAVLVVVEAEGAGMADGAKLPPL